MSLHQTYAVFGLGRYGQAVAEELTNSGTEVLVVDIDEAKVRAVAAELPYCKCADVTDAEVLKQLGIANVDVVLIAMASNLEASVLATMHCKELGVKTVIAKCSDETHRKILRKVGADKVVFPESDSGIRLAKNLLSSGFVDIIELSRDVAMIHIDVKPEWVGKSLLELDLRRKHAINIVAIRVGKDVITNIDPAKPLEKEMKLVVIANPTKIKKLK